MLVNMYRSRPDQTADALIALCTPCAERYSDRVRLEARGARDAECEFCPATNDAAATVRRNEHYDRVNGR